VNSAETLVGLFLAVCRLRKRESSDGNGDDGECPVEHDGLHESGRLSAEGGLVK
jgi:hypothetical protein